METHGVSWADVRDDQRREAAETAEAFLQRAFILIFDDAATDLEKHKAFKP
jgi:hypothetical protein